MKMFRNGYWQKIVLLFALFVQLALIFVGCYLFFLDFIDSEWSFVILLVLSFAQAGLEIFLVNTTTPSEYQIAWLFFVGALPIVGAVFYLLFAHKLRTKKERAFLHNYYTVLRKDPSSEETRRKLQLAAPDAASISRYIETASEGGVYQNTSVEYFPLGDVAFPAMIRELEKAKHYIFLEYFILTPGKMWDAILKILTEKAQAGLDVRVVYDDVGNLGSTPVRYWEYLRTLGIKAYAFARIKPILDIRMNNRDHRKILVIDGHTCFTGGINLADEYINAITKFGHWKDNAIMLKGKGVYGFTLLFLANWVTSFEKKDTIDYEYYRPETYIEEDGGFPISEGFVQPYGDMPYSDHDVGVGAYLSILGKANKYCYISTPYLLLDEKMRDAIRIAALQGVDVRILVPGIPDKNKVFQLTRSNYGPLLFAGVKIYEYTPGFVHQKMFISDDELATDGTINLDYRSLYLHLECGTFIVKNPVIGKMKQDFLDTLAVSREITLEEWKGIYRKKKITWALLRLVAPLL